jgi:7-carboxy-7-deazaguanine synthase
MLIAELFHSIQGEGRFAGTPSLFIRTSGCNLRCWFCDTPYTSWQPEGETYSLDQLLDWTSQFECPHVVITGGEPLLWEELVELTARLKERGHVLTIETAGTVWQPVTCDLMSISPKRGNSTPVGTDWEIRHEQRRHRPDVIRRLLQSYSCQLKFVIDTPDDVADVARWLEEFPEARREDVYLMPQGTEAARLREKLEWIAPAARERGWSVSPRLHIELFGNSRGT